MHVDCPEDSVVRNVVHKYFLTGHSPQDFTKPLLRMNWILKTTKGSRAMTVFFAVKIQVSLKALL